MTIEARINGFAALGEKLGELTTGHHAELFLQAAAQNPWFTAENILRALEGVRHFLIRETLDQWLSRYSLPRQPKRVGLVMAGNIPLVGFHDFMAVLLCGHTAVIKMSSQDRVLPEKIAAMLVAINPAFGAQINFVDTLPGVDAVIATGSDNSARYFKKYFRDIPHIIRQNRTSVAVLDGSESLAELQGLGEDMFSFFGLGCRNVAKVYLPAGYDLAKLPDALQDFAGIANHPKYFNNYEYNKAIYLVNQVPHLDTGFALFKEDQAIVSPLAVVYYQTYESLPQLAGMLQLHENKLQCIVSKVDPGLPTVPFGKAQRPAIDDYADNIDTMAFLTRL